jgi:hypothetical protein
LGVIKLPYPLEKQEPIGLNDNLSSFAVKNALILNELVKNFATKYLDKDVTRNRDDIYNIVDKTIGQVYLIKTELKHIEKQTTIISLTSENILIKNPMLKLVFI